MSNECMFVTTPAVVIRKTAPQPWLQFVLEPPNSDVPYRLPSLARTTPAAGWSSPFEEFAFNEENVPLVVI